MKLYTEEQVRVVYNLGFSDANNNFGRKEDETINFLTPIELPSDEEIEKKVNEISWIHPYYQKGFFNGIKWMKEQILNQNI